MLFPIPLCIPFRFKRDLRDKMKGCIFRLGTTATGVFFDLQISVVRYFLGSVRNVIKRAGLFKKCIVYFLRTLVSVRVLTYSVMDGTVVRNIAFSFDFSTKVRM